MRDAKNLIYVAIILYFLSMFSSQRLELFILSYWGIFTILLYFEARKVKNDSGNSFAMYFHSGFLFLFVIGGLIIRSPMISSEHEVARWYESLIDVYPIIFGSMMICLAPVAFLAIVLILIEKFKKRVIVEEYDNERKI